MARLTLGMWTTHGPILNTTADEWLLRVPFDKRIEHWYKGELYSFEQLVELRRDEDMVTQSSAPEREKRHARCQKDVEQMAQLWEQHKPDVAIILGNDQRELIRDSLQPMFSIYHGETFWQKPLDEEREAKLSPGIKETEWAYRPHENVVWDGLPDLAGHVFDRALEEGFDLAAMASWPETPNDHWHIGTPHAFSWVIRRIMSDRAVPILPVFTNTFFPPNQPTAKRCFEFGRFLARAVRSWDKDLSVGVFGSGGLTHFVIDEELDHQLLDAIQNRDVDTVTSIPQNRLMQGTSELRNWITAAGMLFDSELDGEVIDYVPCYRSEAGTGTAQGFICWHE